MFYYYYGIIYDMLTVVAFFCGGIIKLFMANLVFQMSINKVSVLTFILGNNVVRKNKFEEGL